MTLNDFFFSFITSFMTRKLYALAAGRCSAESADSPSNQEILLGGHLYLMVLKVHIVTITKHDHSCDCHSWFTLHSLHSCNIMKYYCMLSRKK